MTALKIPLYNQLADPLPDGHQDPFASTDCGEECVAMIGAAFGYGGVCGFSAGQVRVILRRGNISGTGTSMPADLVYALSACFKLVATKHDVDWGTALQLVGLAVEQRRATIVLGSWDGAPHWAVCGAVNAEGVTLLDPWGGYVHHISREQFHQLYEGSVVEMLQPLPANP